MPAPVVRAAYGAARPNAPAAARRGVFAWLGVQARRALCPALDCFVCGDGQTDDMGVVSARRGEHLDYPAGTDGLTQIVPGLGSRAGRGEGEIFIGEIHRSLPMAVVGVDEKAGLAGTGGDTPEAARTQLGTDLGKSGDIPADMDGAGGQACWQGSQGIRSRQSIKMRLTAVPPPGRSLRPRSRPAGGGKWG